MCLDTSPPSRLHYHQQCHSHTAPQRSLEGPMQTTSNQRWQTNKTIISVQFQTQKNANSHVKKGKAVNFWTRRDSRNRNSARRECTPLLSASEVREKSSHSGRTWRREWRRKRHYFFQMV